MQLIWVGGPAARVRTFSITARTVVLAFLCVALGLLGLGAASSWMGLRVVVEYSPELLGKVGAGVTSRSELEGVRQRYLAELAKFQGRLGALSERVEEIESVRKGVMERLVLQNLLREKGGPSAGGKGGLTQPPGTDADAELPPQGLDDEPLLQQHGAFMQQLQSLEAVVLQRSRLWETGLQRLEQVPLILPLAVEFSVSSGYGGRADPFTEQHGQHKGVDLVAPVGTPVLATAPGRVTRSEYSGAYGELVEVEHAEGFSTRYAHLLKRRVAVGQRVAARDVLGWLGSTGRSTGPHLHYEVRHLDEPIDPSRTLTAWSQLPQKP